MNFSFQPQTVFLIAQITVLCATLTVTRASERSANLTGTTDSTVLTGSISRAVIAQADNDLGCCVWKTPEAKCSYTNRKYCETKAKQLKVQFEFHKDKSCKDIGACPRPTPR